MHATHLGDRVVGHTNGLDQALLDAECEGVRDRLDVGEIVDGSVDYRGGGGATSFSFQT